MTWSTSEQLRRVLLQTHAVPPAQRNDLLRDVLQADPAFCCWALWQAFAGSWDGCTLDELSAWLEPRLAECLATDVEPVSGAADSAEAQAWLWLRHDDVCGDSNELLTGRAARLPAWLSACGPKISWASLLRHEVVPRSWREVVAALPETSAADSRAAFGPADDDRDDAEAAVADYTHDGGRWLWLQARQSCRLGQLEDTFAEAVEQEKLYALRELAYGASHELNNPLANISTRAQALLRDESDPERRRKLATINAQAFRAHEMISDMMLFAKPPALAPSELELGTLVRQVVDEFRDLAARQSTEFSEALQNDLQLNGDADQLAVAVGAVVRNAFEAVVRGGRVQVETFAEASDTGTPGCVVRVADSGPGLTSQQRSRAFDPYYSGREAGRGLGLGLCKAWRIIEQHGGRIELNNGDTGGAVCRIWLPAASTAAVPVSP